MCERCNEDLLRRKVDIDVMDISVGRLFII